MALSREQIDSRTEQFITSCRGAGIRVTSQRLEVFREVARTEAHPDAETVHRRVRERLPRVSLDTVYRTLASLEKLGVLRKVSALHGAARFDANTSPHHHFVCTHCGCVRDFQSSILDSFSAPAGVLEMGEVESVHAELRGICADCLSPKQTKRPRDI